MAEQRTRNYRGRNKAHICLSRVLLSAVTWAAGSAFVESHIGPLRLSKRHAQITVRALHPHARHRSPLHQPPKTCPASQTIVQAQTAGRRAGRGDGGTTPRNPDIHKIYSGLDSHDGR